MSNTLSKLSPLKAEYASLLNTLGRNTVNALFPDDFEAYFISFELVNSDNETESFITFPVQPNSISEVSTRITNIKQTAGGVVSISTENFVPIDLELKGTFGRGLRFTIGNQYVNGGAISISKKGISLDLSKRSFSTLVKTGYGMIKAIEDILDSSDVLDDFGKPKKLYFYNPILGNNYIVKVKNFVHSQDVSENMIPSYTIQLTAVAPLEESIRKARTEELVELPALNKGLNQSVKRIASIL